MPDDAEYVLGVLLLGDGEEAVAVPLRLDDDVHEGAARAVRERDQAGGHHLHHGCKGEVVRNINAMPMLHYFTGLCISYLLHAVGATQLRKSISNRLYVPFKMFRSSLHLSMRYQSDGATRKQKILRVFHRNCL